MAEDVSNICFQNNKHYILKVMKQISYFRQAALLTQGTQYSLVPTECGIELPYMNDKGLSVDGTQCNSKKQAELHLLALNISPKQHNAL